MKTLLQGGTLLTLNAQSEVVDGANLLIEDDRIAEISPAGKPEEIHADLILDCRDKIIMPGLVSAHSHLTGLFQRGLWDEADFESWSRKSSLTEQAFDPAPEDIHLIHSVACLEFIRHGVTTVLNMFSLPAKEPLTHVDQACRAFTATGIRGILAATVRDQSPEDSAMVTSLSLDRSVSLIREIAECVRGFGVSFMVAPSAPQRCSDRLLLSCRELAEELGIGIHTHLAETKRHAEIGQDLYGEPIVNHLEKLALLSPRLSVAHAIWLQDCEIELLAKHAVKVVHNPSSNMKLGSGIARIKRMLQRGVSVGLGADSVNAGTTYSIFEQIKLAALLPRAFWRVEDWVSPYEAFEMGVKGGAQATLLDPIIGSLEPGKKADLVVLKPSVSLLPLNRVIDQLALCESGASVESVFIDGRPVLLEKKIVTIDEDGMIAQLSSMKPRIERAVASSVSHS